MGFFNKLKKVIIPYVAISSIFLGTLGCAKIKTDSVPKPQTKLEYKINKIQKKQTYKVKKDDSLWKIAKSYLDKNATNQEISKKIKKIQTLSELKPNKNNDNQKYINNKKVRGQDGLIDNIYPGQELVTGIKEKVIYEFKSKSIDKNKSNKKYLLGLIPLTGIAYAGIKKILPKKRNMMYESVIQSYNNNKSLNRIVDECKEFSMKKEFLENKVLSYIKTGIKNNAASRKRYDRIYSNKLGLDSKIKKMIKNKKKYRDIQQYVRKNGMNISYSTIYRIKKAII